MNPVRTFTSEVANYLSRSEGTSQAHKLIRFCEAGEFDFSFPLTLNVWRNYFSSAGVDDEDKYLDNILLYCTGADNDETQATEKFKIASTEWTFVIENVSLKDHRCCFTISRVPTFARLINDIATDSRYGKCPKEENETVSIETDCTNNKSSISQYRADVIANTIKNLIDYSKYTSVEPSIAKHKILVTTKSNPTQNHTLLGRKMLICGVVQNEKDKKISQMNAQDYVAKRCEDMHLISIHKYGVRAKNDEAFKDLVQRLGESAATLDMVEVKQSSAVTLSPDPKQAFILYNSARLETLMSKFNKKVADGYYEKLPDITDIDWSLLKEDEEWQLLKLLLIFPDVIDRSVNELAQGKPALHLIHKYLSSFASTFSVYYRRVQLLTENRAQLMRVLHAKVHFLKAVRKIFNQTLAVLSINPVAFM